MAFSRCWPLGLLYSLGLVILIPWDGNSLKTVESHRYGMRGCQGSHGLEVKVQPLEEAPRVIALPPGLIKANTAIHQS